MRRNSDIISLGQGGDTLEFGEAAAVGDVRLQDVDGGVLQEALDVPAAVEALSQCDWSGGEFGELGDGFGVFGEEGLFDEERAVGFQQLGELFGHGFVQAAVEVEGDVEAEVLDCLEARDGGGQGEGGVEPVEVGGGVHLDGFESLRDPCFTGRSRESADGFWLGYLVFG